MIEREIFLNFFRKFVKFFASILVDSVGNDPTLTNPAAGSWATVFFEAAVLTAQENFPVAASGIPNNCEYLFQVEFHGRFPMG